MTREYETYHAQRRYQIPTHLNLPDKIGINLLGLGLELTVRQVLICLLGGAIAFHLWHALDNLGRVGPFGAVIHLFVPGLIIILTLFVALMRIADRPIETWLAILLEYALRPKVYVWKSIIHDPTYRLHEGEEKLEEMESQDEEEVSS